MLVGFYERQRRGRQAMLELCDVCEAAPLLLEDLR